LRQSYTGQFEKSPIDARSTGLKSLPIALSFDSLTHHGGLTFSCDSQDIL